MEKKKKSKKKKRVGLGTCPDSLYWDVEKKP